MSPCGFALLPPFLASLLAGRDHAGHAVERTLDALRLGALVSLGYAGVFFVAGLAVAAGLRPLLRLVPWAAVALGAGFVAFGSAVALGRRINLRLPIPAAGPRTGSRVRAATAFGAAYAVASLSCTLAIFLAVIGRALATDGVRSMAAVLIAYASGSATLLVGLALSAALARGGLVRILRRLLPVADRVGGVVLVASGISLLAYWLPILTRSSRPWAGPAGLAGAAVTGFLEARRGLMVALAAVLLVTAVGAGWVARRRSLATSTADDVEISPRS